MKSLPGSFHCRGAGSRAHSAGGACSAAQYGTSRNERGEPIMRRRTLMKGAAATLLPLPAIAQPARASTLRLVPQANLTVLDPVFTTAGISNEHGYCVFDMLYAMDSSLRPRPQMAEGHEVG